jgi:hypothetical protein
MASGIVKNKLIYFSNLDLSTQKTTKKKKKNTNLDI